MNSEIEFHDSTFAGVELVGKEAIIRLEPAYLHRSEGRPGIDPPCTGWEQNINLVIFDAVVVFLPSEFPCWLADGIVKVDESSWNNCLPLPFAASGAVEFRAITANSEDLVVRGSRLETVPTGEMWYLESNHWMT